MKVPVLPNRPRPLLFAHRGCSSLAPENTMAAYQKARALGAPGIELDVHICASGELVVAHDDTFRRTAGDTRAIADLNFNAIRDIDVGAFFDACFTGEHPPLLEHVLEEFCPALYIDIELKTRKVTHDPLPDAVAKKLKAFGDRVSQSVLISSFNPFSLRVFKQRVPHIPTSVIWSADADVPPILRYGFGRMIAQCDYLKPVHLQVNRFSHWKFTRVGKRPLVPWTIDTPELAEKMLNIGCEGIITNRPQDLLPLMKVHAHE
jgi:glycerophosphoryl diester phosphodiesterase